MAGVSCCNLFRRRRRKRKSIKTLVGRNREDEREQLSRVMWVADRMFEMSQASGNVIEPAGANNSSPGRVLTSSQEGTHNPSHSQRPRIERVGNSQWLAAFMPSAELMGSMSSISPESLIATLVSLVEGTEQAGPTDFDDQAIKLAEKAIESTSHNDPDRAKMLNDLAGLLQRRFERTGLMDDIDRAITALEQAVDLPPDNDTDRCGMLSDLGTALVSRFERTGSIDDLSRAIMLHEQAVNSIPDGDPDPSMFFVNLGVALRKQFEQTGSIHDLDRAIATIEKGVERTPHDHPNRAGRLCNLGIALHTRFERTGSFSDLDRAVMTNEQAVELTPDDHPDRALRLVGLSNALKSRWGWMGSMDDLDRAIVMNQQAVDITPDVYPSRAMYCSNLGIALRRRFQRTGNIEDLNRAINTIEWAVKSTPRDHPNHAGTLNNLAITLRTRFERTRSMEDLNRSITANERAIECTPEGHPDLPQYLTNLGIALASRFEHMESMDDLDRVVTTIEHAIKLTSHDHAGRVTMLINLGTALWKRFKRTGSMADLDRAIMTNEEAFKSDAAPVSVRLTAASFCSDLLISKGSFGHAKCILQAAVELFPMVSPRELKRNDQQYNISQFATIPSRAVSLCLADGEAPYRSLQMLELGRGILANLQLEVRSDISELAASHPNIAKQFQELRDQIDCPSKIGDPSTTLDSLSIPTSPIFDTNRRATIKQFDDLLRLIRGLTGFENFLHGPSKLELHSLAKAGPIVVFNVSDIRSDAFLITSDEICSLHLPLLKSDTLRDYTNRFFSAIGDQAADRYRRATREVKVVLEWLWDVATSPVLEKLGFIQTPCPDDTWPRLWWVGSGLLNILPIHASGYHDSAASKTVLDRVISSYTPSVKSLAYSRERAVKTDEAGIKEKAIIVAMPTTPDQNALPFVETEVNEIRNLLSDNYIDSRVTRKPTRADVLSELPKYTIAHFACHGYSANNPSQSSLLLEDWKVEPLTVSDISSLSIKSAKFAYLSACHTSAMRDFRLLDECINLVTAIQLSGYPSVVGSLWQVNDKHSAEVGRYLYAWILGDGGFDIQRSAEALHRAVNMLRDKTRFNLGSITQSDPLAWAPYMHVGI